MLEGKCPKCGCHCVGWALANPRNQTCSKCGVGLEITENGLNVFTGYSPFTAERYIINPPSNVPHHRDKDKRKHG
jgi:hypothetical protein